MFNIFIVLALDFLVVTIELIGYVGRLRKLWLRKSISILCRIMIEVQGVFAKTSFFFRRTLIPQAVLNLLLSFVIKLCF